MSLTDRVASGPAPVVHGHPCSVGELYRTLDEAEERAALDLMLYEQQWTATQVFEVLTAEGYTVGRQSINRHRRRQCRCFPDGAES